MELTPEQIAKAETMSLDELRQMALQEAGEIVADPEPQPEAKQARDANGRFSNVDELDNSGEESQTTEEEPQTTIYRKEIENGNGSIDVYEADTLEELVEKIAEGKRNANKQIQEFIRERKESEKKHTQTTEDDEYVFKQKLEKTPKQTIKQLAAEAIAEVQASAQRSQDAQSRFVTTHPTYVANASNGNRLVSWLQTHGETEITYEGLEKAYQDLSKSGLLELKSEEADAATDTEIKDNEQTARSKTEVTQQRSPKKGSTISTRSQATAPRNSGQPTEDEAYSMPLDKLRDLANSQLSKANRSE